MMDLKNKKVTIIGGKRSGIALAKLVHRLKGVAKISENGPKGSFPGDFLKWADEQNILLEFGGHTQAFTEDSDLIVLSPGVRFDSSAVRWAQSKKIPVLGEIEFSFQFCEKPVIAVTGSNGKTTTVTLIRDVLQAAGFRTCLCGNVGQPFAQFVLDLKAQDYVVLEVSSFQMESLLDPQSPFRKKGNKDGFEFKGFEPQIAVVLNVNQNHLDRHKDFDEYFNAKTRIFLNQSKKDFAVLNYADIRLKALGEELISQVRYFNKPSSGKDEPSNPNHMAVLEVAKILKIKEDVCTKVFEEFKGVEHRLEWVRQISGVDFVNDSKATTAEAGAWAINNITKPILMICGGRDKNVDFTVLRGLVKDKVKQMFTIGEARPKLKAAFENVVALEECSGLEDAVKKAKQNAQKGDCVVLSPMCTSFDMFRDYEERGKIFKKIVNEL